MTKDELQEVLYHTLRENTNDLRLNELEKRVNSFIGEYIDRLFPSKEQFRENNECQYALVELIQDYARHMFKVGVGVGIELAK